MKDDSVDIYIHKDFDYSQAPIGFVRIKKEFIDKFPDFTLSPGFIVNSRSEAGSETEVIQFGLIKTESYIKAFNPENSIIEPY